MTLSLITLLLSPTAAAGAPKADLISSIDAPAGLYVYESGEYTVTVTNIGKRTASGVTLTIQLPETNTSPTVHVMGILGATSSSCSLSGTVLNCSLGSIAKDLSQAVTFEIALPESVDPLVIDAHAATSSSESSTSNNDDSYTASLLNYDVSFAPPTSLHIRHCTGTSLASFYECSLYPSSISSHDIVLNADNSLTFVGAGTEYSGVWSSDADDHLSLTYLYLGSVVAEFEGYGVDASCWEGLTTFPGSSWVSPYEVCQ